VKKLLLAAGVLLAVCAVVVAAEKLSEAAKKKVAAVETELRVRLRREPFDFHELCTAEYRRLRFKKDREADPLKSLRTLERGLEWKIEELNPFWKPKEEPEKEYKEPKRIYMQYDITDIISLAPDRYAPTIGFGMGHFLQGSTTRSLIGGIVDFDGDSDAESGAGFDWEKIEELIERLLPEGHEGECRYCGGKLTCYMPQECLKIVEDLLARMRTCTGYSINLEVRFILAKDEYIAELREKGKGSAVYLSAEAEKKLLADAAAKRGVEIVASSEVMASDGQVVNIREGRQVSLLMDYDFSGKEATTLQPLVRVINEGLICQLRPKVLLDGKALNVQVLASLSNLSKDLRKRQFMGGEIVLPSMRLSRLHTTVRVSSGTAVLIGGTAASGDGTDGGQSFIVYVKPTLCPK